MKKLIIFGGNGYIGQVIKDFFAEKQYKITIIARNDIKSQEANKNKPKNYTFVKWNAKNVENHWKNELENADVVINLAGKSVNCRYNEKNKAEIFSSREITTRIIGEAIKQCQNPPKTWLNASTGTIYRHATDKPQDEITGEIGAGFSVEVAKLWEKTFFEAETPQTRKIALRMAIIFGKKGGAFPYYANLAKWGLGGKMGKGNQMISWLHDEDLCNALDFLIGKTHLEGVINLASPYAMRNDAFMQLLRTHYKAWFGLPSTKLMLQIGTFLLQSETELILKSRWVMPKKLLDEGFTFKYNTVEEALKAL